MIKVLVLRDKKKILSLGIVKVATIMFPIQGELNQERLTQFRSIPIIIKGVQKVPEHFDTLQID